MHKNDLITMLQQLDGNPEIVLWNGMVGDWMAISPKLIKGRLVKRIGSKAPWEENQFVDDDEIKSGYYKQKTVYYINAKLRNVSIFDRAGSLRY